MVQLRGCAVIAAVSAMLLCGRAAAQTMVTWNGGAENGLWSDSGNWTGGTPTGNDVHFGESTTTTVSSLSINSLTFDSGTASLGGSGPLTIATTLTDAASSGYSVTISVPIDGAANVVSTGGGTLTLSGDNGYTGGTSITNDGTLVIGSATALGTESLTLGSGSSFFATTNSTFTVGNAISLSGEGSVYLMGGMGSTLTLSGMITGSNFTTLVIDPPGCGGTNYLALTSGCSNFNGNVSVQAGNNTLAVGASSTGSPGSVTQGPLGMGTLMLSNGNDFTTTGSTCFTINNDITLCGGCTVYFLDTNSGHMLTLGGMITGSSRIEVAATDDGGDNYLILNSGCSNFSGISVDEGYTCIQVGASSTGTGSDVSQGPLGTGTLMLSADNDFETTGSGCITIGNNISLCGGGIVYIDAVHGNNNLTLSGTITGSSTLEVGGETSNNYLALTSSGNMFSGGINVEEGSNTIAVGASSVTSGESIIQGPLGTGALMLSDGNNFTTVDSSCYTIDNPITLCGDGNVTLLGGSMGTMLTLNGMITGGSSLEIVAPGCGGSDVVTLNSGCSTFGGGLQVDDGNTTLIAGVSGVGTACDITSSPFGTGVLTLGNGTRLTTPSSTCITVLNQIWLGTGGCNSTVTVGGNGSTLTLAGDIENNYGPAGLIISGPTDLEGQNSYSGGTTVNCNTTLTVGTNNGLGTGPLTANSGSTVTLTSCAPALNSPTLNGATLTFTNTSGTPFLSDLTMMCGSVINFAAGSSPTIENMNSDSSSSDEINLSGGTLLTLEEGVDPAFYGSIGGDGSVEFKSVGIGSEFDLEGTNTYSGGTTVDSGILLVVDNSQALGNGGMLTLNSGSKFGVGSGVIVTNRICIPSDNVKIGGYGTISTGQTITIQSLSGIAGGTGTARTADVDHLVIGTLSFGAGTPLVLGQGGGMQISIGDASGAAGVGYSTIDVAGDVTINAVPGDLTHTFNIQLVGVDSSGLIVDTAYNFNSSQTYHWTLLSAGSITGFSSSDFFVDSSTSFTNPTNGGLFSVSQSGNNLMLNFTPVPEPSTWALMIGGLCMLAGAAVRRRRRA